MNISIKWNVSSFEESRQQSKSLVAYLDQNGVPTLKELNDHQRQFTARWLTHILFPVAPRDQLNSLIKNSSIFTPISIHWPYLMLSMPHSHRLG